MRYRALGADPPFGDPRRAHGVAMEGYFWRIADPRSRRVIVALCGVCRDADGGRWANVALAAHPGGMMRAVDLPHAFADPTALGVRASDADGAPVFTADARTLRVDLGPGARLSVEFADPRPARPTWLGGCGAAHLVPGLSQYWHPHLLGARVTGSAELPGETVDLTGADVYAEKNWGRGGFPERWWWGQAQGFTPARDVAVAFAGGEVRAGPLRVTATGVVVRLGDRMIRLGNPVLAPARVTADGRRWSLDARGPVWSVRLDGDARHSTAHVLPVPDLTARRGVPAAHEHLAGRIALIVRRRGRVAYAGESALAGLEVGERRSGGEHLAEQRGGLGG